MFLFFQKNFGVALTIFFMICSTKAENSTSSLCKRSCGDYSVQYPLGFSGNCKIQLNCSSEHQMEIGEFQVQKITSSSIFIHLPAKCNRSVQSIYSLYSKNFAPTSNNSLLLQNCSSAVRACAIPTGLIGDQSPEGCHKRSGNISCFTQNDLDILTYEDVIRTECKILRSSIAVEPTLSLQLHVLELGWWLEGPCQCSHNANCTQVLLADRDLGYRCQCIEGYIGDGYINGAGCHGDGVARCNVATLMSSACGIAIKISVIFGAIIAVASFIAAVRLSCYFSRRYSSYLRNQMRVKRLLGEAAYNSDLVIHSYKEIERATNFFSEQRKLGSGASCTVYAGKLDHNWVAIKKIKYRDNNSVVQVINEIKLLSSVSHPNLVRILGCCIKEKEQILVLEFMPNGTLSEHLQRKRGALVSWRTRLTIAIETASAIAYLHSAIDPPIYHRDIKSNNILLDFNLRSKVADFGLSRFGMTGISHISTAPQGTPGYVDPQYEHQFHLSDKSDVYSFGVVLAEIITAMKVVDFSRPSNEVNLGVLAVDRIGRGRLDEIIDPFLSPHADAWTNYSIHKVSELAFRCLDSRRDVRPTMTEVADELEYINTQLIVVGAKKN